jgi:hypothetical protein
MAVAAGVTKPLVAMASIIGITRALRAHPKYNCWKSIISLTLSLLITAYFLIWWKYA